jgi:hypothetical protein
MSKKSKGTVRDEKTMADLPVATTTPDGVTSDEKKIEAADNAVVAAAAKTFFGRKFAEETKALVEAGKTQEEKLAEYKEEDRLKNVMGAVAAKAFDVSTKPVDLSVVEEKPKRPPRPLQPKGAFEVQARVGDGDDAEYLRFTVISRGMARAVLRAERLGYRVTSIGELPDLLVSQPAPTPKHTLVIKQTYCAVDRTLPRLDLDKVNQNAGLPPLGKSE